MKRLGDVIVLELPATLMGTPSVIHPVALVGPDHILTLVDTGLPGMLDAIISELHAADFTLGQVQRVIVTHHDLDHIGSLDAVVHATGAEVWALEPEVPYVTGERRAQKLPSPEQAQAILADPDLNPTTRAMLTREPTRVPVSRALRDGDLLPGQVRVIATPGHTPGHLSLLVPGGNILISGDALTAQGGMLHGPLSHATPDLPGAHASVRRLAQEDVQTIVTYHGGVVSDDAGGQLRALAASLNS
ncbi:MBL fold metallo-hydrolase [Deinococcus sp. 6YEL10]|uniref:MBL fold metallo-hydrolase n=1 Tax=Deinococcus sp. 6YEL10 TaxID=2745870 RepID=UPI001E381EDB|nr:MBL fold metallo-hydrolase [Deinococcus sp. 6YEL10]MCD0163444.1 MBL fold metallo-hydrolase [Deinococcus sp. 6YEL10]